MMKLSLFVLEEFMYLEEGRSDSGSIVLKGKLPDGRAALKSGRQLFRTNYNSAPGPRFSRNAEVIWKTKYL